MLLALDKDDSQPQSARDDLIDVLEAVFKAQLSTLRRLRRSAPPKPRLNGSAPEKRMPHIEIVYDILMEARCPLHVSQILARAAPVCATCCPLGRFAAWSTTRSAVPGTTPWLGW